MSVRTSCVPAVSFAGIPICLLSGTAAAVSPNGNLWFPAVDYRPGGGIVNPYRSVLVEMTPNGTFTPYVLETCTIPTSSIFFSAAVFRGQGAGHT